MGTFLGLDLVKLQAKTYQVSCGLQTHGCRQGIATAAVMASVHPEMLTVLVAAAQQHTTRELRALRPSKHLNRWCRLVPVGVGGCAKVWSMCATRTACYLLLCTH